MMTNQTKAQRLADQLEDESGGVLLGFIPGQPVQEKELDCNFEAAAELRRLDALNAELLGAIANLINVRGRHHTEIAYQRLIAAYNKAKEQK